MQFARGGTTVEARRCAHCVGLFATRATAVGTLLLEEESDCAIPRLGSACQPCAGCFRVTQPMQPCAQCGAALCCGAEHRCELLRVAPNADLLMVLLAAQRHDVLLSLTDHPAPFGAQRAGGSSEEASAMPIFRRDFGVHACPRWKVTMKT